MKKCLIKNSSSTPKGTFDDRAAFFFYFPPEIILAFMVHLVVDADKRSRLLNLRELVHYQDLFYILAYRDLRVRYAQTFLGLTWAFLQPLATLTIFTVVFGRAVKVDTGGVPYPLFAITGMAAWTYFAFVMKESGSSIISAQQMVKKIYFPRLVIPLSKAVVGFVTSALPCC